MVRLQHSPGVGQVRIVLRLLLPGELQHTLDIGPQGRLLMAARRQIPIALDFPFHLFPDLRGHVLLFQPLPHGLHLCGLGVSQLLADGLDLLP